MADFEIIEKEIGDVIEIEEDISMLKMAKVMSTDFTALMNYLESNKAEFKDAPYAKYVNINWEAQISNGFFKNMIEMFIKNWHFFCGIPVNKRLKSTGTIIIKNYPKQKYVKAVHYGPYQNVGKLYTKMYIWLKENGYEALPESIEFYTNNPRDVKKEEIETILLIPIKQ